MKETHCGRVLVVEDDLRVAEMIRFALESANFQMVHVDDGRVGLEQAVSGQFDVILLDIRLPGMDGYSICREAQKQVTTPIMMLSDRREDLDKVLGLETGADDYLGKPFNPLELVARVRALQRRKRLGAPEVASEDRLQLGHLQITPSSRQVTIQGQPVHLTATEFEVLVTMARRPGRVFTRQDLIDLCWGSDWVGFEKTVDVHLRRMRKKFSEWTDHDYIKSVRGVGYRLEPG
ncbi:response regulator transcription factor [bacterium]|nr:response regulator transcription factor [bacterium]